MKTIKTITLWVVRVLIAANILLHLIRRGFTYLLHILYLNAGSPEQGYFSVWNDRLSSWSQAIDSAAPWFAVCFSALLGILLLCQLLSFKHYWYSLSAFLLLPFPALYIQKFFFLPVRSAGLFSLPGPLLSREPLWIAIVVPCAIYAVLLLLKRLCAQRQN